MSVPWSQVVRDGLLRLVIRRLPAAVLAALLGSLPATAADWGRAVVETTMQRHPNPTTLGGWNYPAAVYLYGQYLVFKRTGNWRYFNYIKNWVDAHIEANGNIGAELDALDRIMPGLLLIFLYQETGDSKYKRAAENVRRALDAQKRTRDGGFWHASEVRYRLWGLLHTIRTGGKLWSFWHTNEPEGKLWADGAFMMVPFLVEYGRIFLDDASGEEAVRQLLIYAEHLQDPATGLLYHAYDETGRAPWLELGTKHSQEFWCRAVGWYGLALVHALDRLGDHPRRPELIGVLSKLAAALERYQDPRSGRWFQVMDKGALPANWTETSCSSMHAYVLARAVRNGYLPPRYAGAAAKGYRGVLDMISLDAEGMTNLDGISAGTSVGTLRFYLARPRLANDPHGLGAFLLMLEQLREPPLLEVTR